MARYVVLEMPEEDYAFIVGFDPDRDRSCNRAELVEVLLDMQDIVGDAYIGEEFDREED